jgi:hypothetical protein
MRMLDVFAAMLMLGFKRLRSAVTTISDIALMHRILKG